MVDMHNTVTAHLFSCPDVCFCFFFKLCSLNDCFVLLFIIWLVFVESSLLLPFQTMQAC